MLVGWGGNNGSTLTASVIANRDSLTWKTKEGTQTSNYYGSMLLASTTKIGIDSQGEDVFFPLKDLVPMCDPNQLGNH
jgi:myo-inositol-1-phosphate synthase